MRVEAGLAAEDFQRAEQRRRGFAAADGDADRLEHLAGFDAEFDAAARRAASRPS